MAKKPKKKRKIPLRTQIRRAAKRAHEALSAYVREHTRRKFGGKCPLCGRGPLLPRPPKKITAKHPETHESAIQCVFHFVRSKFSKYLRYDVRNVIGACHTCNWVEYRNPDPSRAWYVKHYGHEAYLQLVSEHARDIEYTLEYFLAIENKYTMLLTSLMGKPPEQPVGEMF